MLDPRLAAALTPPRPGRLVRWLSPVAPGVRATDEQIRAHAAHWALEAERALSAPVVLVAIGDSLAQGVGARDPADGYVGRLRGALAERLGAERIGVLNLSRSGARVRDVLDVQLPALESIVADLADPAPIVVGTVGSNDLLRGGTPGRVAREIHRLHRRLPAGTVLSTLPEPGSLSARILNRRLRAEAIDHDLTLVDVNRTLSSWKGLAAGDRFHPNEAGYLHWFDAFAPAVFARVDAADDRGD